MLLRRAPAEKLVFGELSTGRLTISHRHRPRHDHPLGMDEGLGYIAFGRRSGHALHRELAQGGCRAAESTQARIDQAIRDIIGYGVFERATGSSTPTARCWSVRESLKRTKAISADADCSTKT